MVYKTLQETWIRNQHLENYKAGVKGDVVDKTCREASQSGPCICTQSDSTNSTTGIYKDYDSCSYDGINYYTCITDIDTGSRVSLDAYEWCCFGNPCSN